MYGVFDISTSALVAHRTNLDVIAGNIAMKDSMSFDASGEPTPYRRRVALYAPAQAGGSGAASDAARPAGVRIAAIVEDPLGFGKRWDPSHPFAYKEGPNKGYVPLSNVDYTTEMVDAMTAQRAYEANVTVIEMTKSMASSALRLIA